jgi:hypothetical protein
MRARPAMTLSRMPLMVRAESLVRPRQRRAGDALAQKKGKHALVDEAFARARVFVQMDGDFLGWAARQHGSRLRAAIARRASCAPILFQIPGPSQIAAGVSKCRQHLPERSSRACHREKLQ